MPQVVVAAVNFSARNKAPADGGSAGAQGQGGAETFGAPY